MKLKRGDPVWWWSTGHKSKAVFVEHDQDFPDRFCILAIGIGVRPDRMTHTFRWPLRQVAYREEGRTMTKQRRMKGV